VAVSEFDVAARRAFAVAEHMVHIADHGRGSGDQALCGKPLKPYTVGNGEVCPECRARLKGGGA
jgi:hypothetical protein